MWGLPFINPRMSTFSSQYLSEERHPRALNVSIAFYVFSIVAVALRLLSRRLVRARIQWDDILIIFALVAYSGPFATIIIGMRLSCSVFCSC